MQVGDRVQISQGAPVQNASYNGGWFNTMKCYDGEVLALDASYAHVRFDENAGDVYRCYQSDLVLLVASAAPPVADDPLDKVFAVVEKQQKPKGDHLCRCDINQLVFGGCVCGGK